jgi:hypothetical protein
MFQREAVEKIKIYILCTITPPPPPENGAVYEIMWKNVIESDKAQMAIWRVRVACWITKATYAHSQYLILIFQLNSGYANAPQCYVERTLPAFLSVNLW